MSEKLLRRGTYRALWESWPPPIEIENLDGTTQTIQPGRQPVRDWSGHIAEFSSSSGTLSLSLYDTESAPKLSKGDRGVLSVFGYGIAPGWLQIHDVRVRAKPKRGIVGQGVAAVVVLFTKETSTQDCVIVDRSSVSP